MADLGRLLQALASIVRETFPNLDFLGVYIYEVFSWNDGAQTADLKPVGNSKMPTLTGVQPRLPGLQVKLKAGDQVLVGFQDGLSSQPFIAQLMTGSANSGALPIATQGSMVSAGGLGTMILLTPVPPNVSPSVLPGVPYLVSFGTVTNPPLPAPAPQGKLFGVTSSGSLRVKTI